MKRFERMAAMILGAALLSAAVVAADDEVDMGPALKATQAWLAQVDAGKYGQSWDDAAALFQGAMPKDKWERSLVSVRTPLGSVVARKMYQAKYMKELPNAPAGEYVVIEYQTSFENRPLSVETVTPMRQKDGSWKVAGYYIR